MIKNVVKDKQTLEFDKVKEPAYALLTSIGQLSVWSFHELMNNLAKAHGYAEMLEDILSTTSRFFF